MHEEPQTSKQTDDIPLQSQSELVWQIDWGVNKYIECWKHGDFDRYIIYVRNMVVKTILVKMNYAHNITTSRNGNT